jgi:plasmanylethanolamine desaturase
MTVASFVGEALIGWLIADLLSGTFHIWQDHGRERWPVIGKFLISPAVLHHKKPLAFAEQSHAWRNGTTYVGVLAIAAAWLALLGPSVTLAAATVGGMLSTQVHYWAHRPSTAPAIVRVLQEIGLLQSPKGHAGHHRPPHKQNYCALTDWLNPIVNRAIRRFL